MKNKEDGRDGRQEMRTRRRRIGIALAVLIAASVTQATAFADNSCMSPTGDLKIPIPGSVRVAKIEDGVQTVITPLESGKYLPFTLQKGIPVRWVIRASADDLKGCNSTIMVPTYGIRKQLVLGDNMIEFTPDREGTIRYTCSMGMISSTIRVVPDLAWALIEDGNLYGSSEKQNSPGGVR